MEFTPLHYKTVIEQGKNTEWEYLFYVCSIFFVVVCRFAVVVLVVLEACLIC